MVWKRSGLLAMIFATTPTRSITKMSEVDNPTVRIPSMPSRTLRSENFQTTNEIAFSEIQLAEFATHYLRLLTNIILC